MSEEWVTIKKILVPIDGSDASLKAAKCEKVQIICMSVVAIPENTSEFVGKPQSYYDELKKSTRPRFEEIKEAGKKMGIGDDDISTDIVPDFSSIPQAIVCYTSNKNADLIVICTTGKNRIETEVLLRAWCVMPTVLF